MSEREVDKARGVVEKATPGPWHATESQKEHVRWEVWHPLDPAFLSSDGVAVNGVPCNEANATFIATFDPDFVRKLLDLWKVAQTLSDSPPGKRYGFLPLYNALEALEQTGDRS